MYYVYINVYIHVYIHVYMYFYTKLREITLYLPQKYALQIPLGS